MPGSPKKRAKRLAREEAERRARAEQSAADDRSIAHDPAGRRESQDRTDKALPLAAPAGLVYGDVLPPIKDEDVTHTARKRAMRRKAAEFAEEAIQTLVKGMRSDNEKIAQDSADKILKAAGLHDPDKDKMAEGLVIQILKLATGEASNA